MGGGTSLFVSWNFVVFWRVLWFSEGFFGFCCFMLFFWVMTSFMASLRLFPC